MEIVHPLKSQLFLGCGASRVLLTDLGLCLFIYFFGGLAYYTYFPRVLVEVLISVCQN